MLLLLQASGALLLQAASGVLLLLGPTPGPGSERMGRGVVGSPMIRAKDAPRRSEPFVADLTLLLPTPAMGALHCFLGIPTTEFSNAVAKGEVNQYLARLRCVDHRQWPLCASSLAWERCQLGWCFV